MNLLDLSDDIMGIILDRVEILRPDKYAKSNKKRCHKQLAHNITFIADLRFMDGYSAVDYYFQARRGYVQSYIGHHGGFSSYPWGLDGKHRLYTNIKEPDNRRYCVDPIILDPGNWRQIKRFRTAYYPANIADYTSPLRHDSVYDNISQDRAVFRRVLRELKTSSPRGKKKRKYQRRVLGEIWKIELLRSHCDRLKFQI